jgi:hypothetical protein
MGVDGTKELGLGHLEGRRRPTPTRHLTPPASYRPYKGSRRVIRFLSSVRSWVFASCGGTHCIFDAAQRRAFCFFSACFVLFSRDGRKSAKGSQSKHPWMPIECCRPLWLAPCPGTDLTPPFCIHLPARREGTRDFLSGLEATSASRLNTNDWRQARGTPSPRCLPSN